MVNNHPGLSASGATSPRLRGLTVVILILLAAQFLLGMAVNLFVTIPTNHPGANPPEYFSGVFQSMKWAVTSSSSPLWLLLHASLGLVLVVLTIALLISAIVARKGAGLLWQAWVLSACWVQVLTAGAFRTTMKTLAPCSCPLVLFWPWLPIVLVWPEGNNRGFRTPLKASQTVKVSC